MTDMLVGISVGLFITGSVLLMFYLFARAVLKL